MLRISYPSLRPTNLPIDYLKKLFLKNSYPNWWITKAESDITRGAATKKEDQDESAVYSLLRTPYIGNDSRKLGRKLTRIFQKYLDVQLCILYNSFKVGNYFTLKNREPWQLTPNVVYKFQCSVDRDVTYIGMCSRQLVARVSEHFDPKRNSAVQDHVAHCKECSNSSNCLDRFEVLQFCRNKYDTEVAEAMLITEHSSFLNKLPGILNGCSAQCSFTTKAFK